MTFGRGSHRLGPSVATSAPVSSERRGDTVRRILVFFRPYRRQIAVVVLAIVILYAGGLFTTLAMRKPVLARVSPDRSVMRTL